MNDPRYEACLVPGCIIFLNIAFAKAVLKSYYIEYGLRNGTMFIGKLNLMLKQLPFHGARFLNLTIVSVHVPDGDRLRKYNQTATKLNRNGQSYPSP